MPRKPPPRGTPFPKGLSGNPGGRPKLPDDVAEARKLNRVEFERLLNLHIYKTRDELKATIDDSATSMLDIVVCTILIKAAKEGDPQRLTFVLDRLLGKVTTPLEVTAVQPFIITRRDGTTVEMGSRPALTGTGE